MDVMSKLPGPRRVRWLQVRDREQDAKQKAKGMCAECRSHPAIRDFRNAKLQKMISPFCKKSEVEKDGQSVQVVPPLLFSRLVE